MRQAIHVINVAHVTLLIILLLFLSHDGLEDNRWLNENQTRDLNENFHTHNWNFSLYVFKRDLIYDGYIIINMTKSLICKSMKILLSLWLIRFLC